MSRGTWILIGLGAVLVAWFAFGQYLGQTVAKPLARELVVPDPVPAGAPLHGVAWQITHVYDVVNKADRMMREIADLGADTVMISAARYQEHAASPEIYNDAEKMPTDAEWKAIIASAHKHNLRVMLMPIVLLANPRGTEWRGEIKPPNWDVWWKTYEEYIVHMARIAEANDVEVMTVGSELVSTEKFTERWREVIRGVRKVYKGKLSYSSNWDHYHHIEFWKDLDYVGMTTYHQLSDKPGPEVAALVEAWEKIKKDILAWQKSVGKPIVFTEIGWCSQEGASIEAWNYYHDQRATKAGLEEQRRLYVAFMETWSDVPQIGGYIWWEWTESDGGEDDYNYTPRGKPAEKELRAWFAEQRRRMRERPTTTATATTQRAETLTSGAPGDGDDDEMDDNAKRQADAESPITP